MTRPLPVPLSPVSAAAFAPFGQVLEVSGAGVGANQGTARRYDHAAALENRRPSSATPNLSVFACAPRALPLEIRLLERHPHSTQAFIPMNAARYIVVVSPTLADGSPHLEQARAFLCGGLQGVNYNAGTWHHPMIALDRDCQFAMLAYEDGSVNDCEERVLATPLLLDAR